MGQRAELHREIMKVILLVAGSDGDIHPPLGLGCELVRRGHDVLFVTTFDYVELAQACGLQALSVIGPAEAEEFKRTDNLGPVAKIKARCKFFSQKVDYICEVLANKLADRSIVVAPPFGYAVAKLLHLGYGVPYISTVQSLFTEESARLQIREMVVAASLCCAVAAFPKRRANGCRPGHRHAAEAYGSKTRSTVASARRE